MLYLRESATDWGLSQQYSLTTHNSFNAVWAPCRTPPPSRTLKEEEEKKMTPAAVVANTAHFSSTASSTAVCVCFDSCAGMQEHHIERLACNFAATLFWSRLAMAFSSAMQLTLWWVLIREICFVLFCFCKSVCEPFLLPPCSSTEPFTGGAVLKSLRIKTQREILSHLDKCV